MGGGVILIDEITCYSPPEINKQEIIGCANDLLGSNGRGLQVLKGAGSSDVRGALRLNPGHCHHLNEVASSQHRWEIWRGLKPGN